MITFQQLIQRLSHFWEKQGCIIHQGHDLEVGAGTFNPATFLRSLGPEPYRTAYVEPSRRPSDGRYGENPNRVQLFHQYQVILKPSPPNIQELYLKSLEAVGLNLKEHDIRFVHDDWESPSLGAWGLGWEVWIDGMEASQFTYFQAIASLPLKAISGEITYGLERLAMFLQQVDNIFDIQWNEKLTLRDISHRNEVEWSAYNFNYASTAMWLHHFDDFEKEAKQLIALHLPIPAYDFVIKASHAFNLLDARGAISVTERTGYIARIRELSRLIAMEYLTSREKLGFPLLAKEKSVPAPVVKTAKIATSFNPKKSDDLLLEIGSEQLPATFVPFGCKQLEEGVRKLLTENALHFDSLHVYGTPRRLAVLVEGLIGGSASKEMEKRGPAISAAFDAKGDLTPQGEGFFKSLQLPLVNLDKIRSGKAKGIKIAAVKENEYLFASVVQPGKSTFALLAAELPSLICNLSFPKKMRWGTSEISYARPLHWIVALYGKKIIPFHVGEISSNRFSFGHAQRDPKKITFKEPSEYLSLLRSHFVLADIEERKKSILDQLQTIEKKHKGQALQKERVLREVLHLTEWPELTEATFDQRFLQAPPEILISEMVEHQRYFPFADAQGKLQNLFIITADNTPNTLIRHGNQKVLSARLSDGVFLYEQDLNTPLEAFNEKLQVMTFQKELGSMLDKVKRILFHAEVLNKHLEIADQKKVLRAALLCKADLTSNLVGEFPELQGTIGKYLALAQKEDPEVAAAMEEQWMPRGENAPLPRTPTGIILSLADKIDNLLAYFSIGLKPTSSNDPYALRRQVFGLLKILIEDKRSLQLDKLLMACTPAFTQIKNAQTIVEEILQFITNRAKSLFEEYGFRKDEIEASLRGVCNDPFDQFCKVQALHQFRSSGTQFAHLFEVYKRAKGQLEIPAKAPFNPSLAQEPAEKALLQQLETVQKTLPTALAEKNYMKAFQTIATLQPPLAALFDSVKILADDPAQRENRIALLQKVFHHFETLLDFSKIQS